MDTGQPDLSPSGESAVAGRIKADDQPAELPIIGRRRTLLINPTFQLRALFLPTVISVGTVTALLLTLYRVLNADAEVMGGQTPWVSRWLWHSLSLSIIYAALLFFIGLMETHRAAGAIFKLHRFIIRVAAGDRKSRVYLRRRDHFHDMADDFNRMMNSLEREVHEDLEAVNRALQAIGQIRPSGADPSSQRLAEGWDELVAIKQRKEMMLH